jgi:hypothetical protein
LAVLPRGKQKEGKRRKKNTNNKGGIKKESRRLRENWVQPKKKEE